MIAIILRSFYGQDESNLFVYRDILVVVFLIYLLGWKLLFHPFKIINYYLIYLITIIPLSDYLINSLSGTSHTFIILMMLPVGYYFFNEIRNFFQLTNIIIIILLLFVLYIISINFLGMQVINEGVNLSYGSFLPGTFGTSQINIISVILIISPFLLKICKSRFKKKLFVILLFLSAVFLILNFKRTSIISVLIGISFYFIVKYKIHGAIRLASMILLLSLTLSVLFYKQLQNQIEARSYIFSEETYSTNGGETRLLEFSIVLDELNNRNILNVLFGKNTYYTLDIGLRYLGFERVLHNDWTNLLVTTGIIGLILYIVLLYNIWRWVFRLKPNDDLKMSMKTVALSLFYSNLIFFIFGGFAFSLQSTSICFFFWGSTISIISNQSSIQK